MVRKEVPAGVFKQGCLTLIDDVATSKREIIITKRGKPVARLVPMEDPREREHELLERNALQRALTASYLTCRVGTARPRAG